MNGLFQEYPYWHECCSQFNSEFSDTASSTNGICIILKSEELSIQSHVDMLSAWIWMVFATLAPFIPGQFSLVLTLGPSPKFRTLTHALPSTYWAPAHLLKGEDHWQYTMCPITLVFLFCALSSLNFLNCLAWCFKINDSLWPLNPHFTFLFLNSESFIPIVLTESKTLRFATISKVAKLA